MALKLITPPDCEPLMLADMEAQMQYALPFDQQNAVAGFITAVRQKVENGLRRALITQTWELTLDAFPDASSSNRFASVYLPLPPLQSVESIKYLSVDNVLTTLAVEDYVVAADATPGRVTPAYGKTWPQTLDYPGAVKIRFVAGYGADSTAVPQCIRNWMLLNAANLYEHRETVSIGAGGAIELETLADSLLDPERWGVRV